MGASEGVFVHAGLKISRLPLLSSPLFRLLAVVF